MNQVISSGLYRTQLDINITNKNVYIFRGGFDRYTGGVERATILKISKLCIGLEKAAACCRSLRADLSAPLRPASLFIAIEREINPLHLCRVHPCCLRRNE